MSVDGGWGAHVRGEQEGGGENVGAHGCAPLSHPSHLPFNACRHPTKCPKNHVDFFEDRHGIHASLFAIHFKNDAIKGEQELPLSPSLLKPLTMLAQGIAHSFPLATHLFFDTHGSLYKGPYFSHVVSQAISVDGLHLTATDVRHMFVTLWKDFINCPTTQLLDLTMHQLNASAADLMLNSTNAWAISYDDTNRNRAINTTLHMWPKFVKFVKEAHLDAISRKELNPLNIDIATLPS